MNESYYILHNNLNETAHIKATEDTKYFYVAIASLVIFFLISIITTVLLCVTLKNEPILWETDVEKPPELDDTNLDELQDTSQVNVIEDENNI